MPNKELQEILGARFEGHTHSTNESVWTAIESQLDAEKSDRIGLWFWIFNGIAATFLIGILIQSGIRTEISSNTQISKTATQKEIRNEKIENSTALNEINQSSVTTSLSKTSSPENSSVDNRRITNSSKNERVIENSLQQERDALVRDHQELKSEEPASSNNLTGQFASKQESVNSDQLNPLNRRTYSADLNRSDIIEILPKSLSAPRAPYFRRLPIHLGVEFTYLNKVRLSSKSAPSAAPTPDTSYTWTNDELAKNRHFELGFLSQFDFTPRFSTSIGFAYSSSQYLKPTTPGTLTSTFDGPIEASQWLIAIPIQAKYAIYKKNRFALSAGLTTQMEFGRNIYSESSIETSTIVTFPEPLSEEALIVTKQRIRQFALEPFMQLSIGISPRIKTYINLGYRTYIRAFNGSISQQSKMNYIHTDFGLQFRIH